MGVGAERGVAWYSIAMGYGALTQRSAVESRPVDTFVADFLWGVPATSQVRCGIKMGGWLIEPFDLVSGRSFSNYLAVVDVQPRRRWAPFVRVGAGVGAFYDLATNANASGWAGTVGLGWDLAPERRWLTPLVFEYSWGRPGDAARSSPAFQDLRYRAASVTLAFGQVAFPVGIQEATAPEMFWRTPVGVRIQGGGHLLTQELGVLPPGVVDGQESTKGIETALKLQVERGGSRRYGLGMGIARNGVDIGTQTFRIGTMRVTARTEHAWPFLGPHTGYDARPYFLFGAGWNFHWVGKKVTYPLGAPTGAATHLGLDSSPCLELGLGADFPAYPGFALNVEAGWVWNTAGYRLSIEGSPERTGDAKLSGTFLLVGIGLGKPHGAR